MLNFFTHKPQIVFEQQTVFYDYYQHIYISFIIIFKASTAWLLAKTNTL